MGRARIWFAINLACLALCVIVFVDSLRKLF